MITKQEFDLIQPNTELFGKVRLPESIVIDDRDVCDLELLLNGALKPLATYLDLNNYVSVVENLQLTNCYPWGIPICLKVKANESELVDDNQNEIQEIKIRDQTNLLLATIKVTSIYKPDIVRESQVIYNDDISQHAPCHPFIKYLVNYCSNHFYISGELSVVNEIKHYLYRKYRLTPAQVGKILKQRNMSTVVGFQTRNPMHRSHFELTVRALKEAETQTNKKALLFLSPAIGPTQPGDIDYLTRIKCYEAILSKYEDQPLLCLLPLAMRMAGPREALLHAQIRKNYHCTHFIVGRDHAAPSCQSFNGTPFYGPYDAQKLVQQYSNSLGIRPLFSENIVYSATKDKFILASEATNEDNIQTISGTKFREALMTNEPIPEWFCFSDVVNVLRKHILPPMRRGFCVYFTGLPCSGKSTLALCLEALLIENRQESRKITILDADIIRTHLSKGLGFSKADRSANVRRIGYLASEITKHGGICLVANIAPYEEDRLFNRNLITSAGGNYVEVYVSTPLECCETRDVKHLYQQARDGIIKSFTGINDPYEIPKNPEIVVNSSSNLDDCVQTVFNELKKLKYVV